MSSDSALNSDVVPLEYAQIPALLPLWRDYQRFYEIPAAQISDTDNRKHIEYILSHPERGRIFLIRADGSIVGFATIYYSFSSIAAAALGVINDLYVTPACRGRGRGRALLDFCIGFLRERGVTIAEWATRPDNRQAQQLYDRYVPAENWLVYRISCDHASGR